MIYVDRHKVPPPETFSILAMPALRALEIAAKDLGRQQKLPFDRQIYRSREVVQALHQLFDGKCAFCESYVGSMHEVVHFRPMARASSLDGAVSPQHYWWLAYDWSNLYLSCTDCYKYKATRFPVRGRRADPGTRGGQLDKKEHRLLMDPCSPSAGLTFEFRASGLILSRDLEANTTIDVFSLNRTGLVRLRRHKWRENTKRFATIIRSKPREQWTADRFREEVRKQLEPQESFIGLTLQQAVKFWTQRRNPRQSPDLDVDDEGNSLDEDFNRRIAPPAPDWLRKIEIENFRALQHVTLELPEIPTTWAQDNLDSDDQEPWIVLLGNNGVGKSSILKAIALALSGPAELKHLAELKDFPMAPRSAITEGRSQAKGRVRLWFTKRRTPLEMTFNRNSREFKITGQRPGMPVLAYGSTRLLPRVTNLSAPTRTAQIGNLFDSAEQLSNGARWLASPTAIKQRDFDLLSTDLKGLLGLEQKDSLVRAKGQLAARLFGKKLPVSSLSDGFQSVLALVLDMMRTLSAQTMDMSSVEALVLLDEIEVHLHPTWKARIVSDLRKLFPRTRFIVTTHDPLCVQGLAPGELHVMTRNEKSKRVELRQVDVPPGLRADQILTGEWFGLGSTRDPETLRLMGLHSQLLLIPNRNDTQETERKNIESILRSRLGRFGDSPYEQAGLQAYAELAPKGGGLTPAVEKERLSKRIRELLPTPAER